MELYISFWGYLLAASVCGILAGAYVLLPKYGQLLFFAKVFLKSKNNVEARIAIFEIHQGFCKMHEPEKFAASNLVWLKYGFLFKPETVQLLLSNSFEIDKAEDYRFLHPWLRTGLLTRMADTVITRTLNPLLWNDAVYYSLPQGWRFLKNLKILHDFTRKIIRKKKEFHFNHQRSSSNEGNGLKKRKAFLELLLEHHYLDKTFTEEDIHEEVDTFMFEGHDTTAMGISWVLYCLGLYPEIQDKVYRELKSIFEDDPERLVTSEDLTKMNYLERVIKETFRLYPPVPIIARKWKGNMKVMNNTITPDFTSLVQVFILHRDQENFPDPEKFDPDRFLPQNFSQIHPFAYVPFSAGPRNCIGQRFALIEVKIVLAHVLRNFKVVSLDQRDKIRLMIGLVLKSADPLRIKFIERIPDPSEAKFIEPELLGNYKTSS